MDAHNGNYFAQALHSKSVTLKLGGDRDDSPPISKALLAHKSETFAKLLSKPGLTELEVEMSSGVCNVFVQWVYQDRLYPPENPSAEERKVWKELMLDLWMFADQFDIPKLQNEVMRQLTSLHVFGKATSLDKSDIPYVWSHLNGHTGNPLKNLIAMTLVVKIETGAVEKIRDYEDLAVLPGFMAKVYEALKMWLTTKGPVKERWTNLLESEKLSKAFMVKEVRQVPVQAEQRAPPRPFEPGEVIEID